MYTRAVDLKEFYAGLQGLVVQRVIRQRVRELWPSVKGERVIGVGYAAPYLRSFIDEAERVGCLLPMQQGAIAWPSNGKGLVSVCDESALPLETSSVDRLFVIHTMNSAESMSLLLEEAWRVLKGQGRLLMVLPNRSGMWARVDNNPFGSSTPYSMGQIRHWLKEHRFVSEWEGRALFFPPTSSRLVLATARMWESVGGNLFEACGGVNIVEASKQLYAGTTVGEEVKRKKAFIPVPAASVSSGISRS